MNDEEKVTLQMTKPLLKEKVQNMVLTNSLEAFPKAIKQNDSEMVAAIAESLKVCFG